MTTVKPLFKLLKIIDKLHVDWNIQFRTLTSLSHMLYDSMLCLILRTSKFQNIYDIEVSLCTDYSKR